MELYINFLVKLLKLILINRIMENDLIQDTQHWQNLKPPLCPNVEEIKIYKDLVEGMNPVCMLGMTKELMQLCDYMVDLNPIEVPKKVIKSDWFSLEECADAIIGDGVINLTNNKLIEKMRKLCNKLICRVFTKKLPGMKYAQNFPTEFPESKLIIPTQENVVIVVWEGLHSTSGVQIN